MGATPKQGDDTVDLRRLLMTLWRRKMVIVSTMLIVTSIAVLIVMQLTPLFIAEAQIVVEPPRSNVVDIDSVAQNMATDYYTNETQAAILASRVLAEQVVDQLGLVSDPEFNPSLATPRAGLFDRLLSLARVPRSWLTALYDFRAAMESDKENSFEQLSPFEQRRVLRDNAISIYLSQLRATPSDSSRVISISFTSKNPVAAARFANATARAYIDDQLRAKAELTEFAGAWLQNHASDLETRVSNAARAVEAHRRSSGLVSVGGSSLLSKQLAEINLQLIAARAARAEAGARFKQVRRMIKSDKGVESAAAVLDSPLIQRLREQESEVARNIAELKTQYREGHPKMILARSELEVLTSKIRSEVRKIVAKLGNELEIAEVRESNLGDAVVGLQDNLDAQAGAEITLRGLETELEANQKLYDIILTRLKEAGVQDSAMLQADARIISLATVPAFPSYPRKRLIVGIIFVASTILGVLIVLLLEHLDSGFRSREQIEALTGLAALSVIPYLRARRMSGAGPHDDIMERPYTLLAESMRTLRTSLLLSNVDSPPRTILLTSSVPGEGKTMTALMLARTIAKHGQKCIVVDGDLRNPSLHHLLEVHNDIGLVDHLSHDAPIEDMIQIDFNSGTHFILAGRSVAHGTDLLGSDKMRGLIASLREVYDFVIIDTPPVLAMSDTLVLLRDIDKTLFLVQWEKTRRETAIAGLRQVIAAGAEVAGVILSQVDMRKHAQYDYGGSTQYGYYYYGGEHQGDTGT